MALRWMFFLQSDDETVQVAADFGGFRGKFAKTRPREVGSSMWFQAGSPWWGLNPTACALYIVLPCD